MLKGNWLPKMFHQIARRQPHQEVLREAPGSWGDNMSEVISGDRGSLPLFLSGHSLRSWRDLTAGTGGCREGPSVTLHKTP